MYERFYSPNIMALASSQVGEDSLSVGTFSFFLFVNGIVVENEENGIYELSLKYLVTGKYVDEIIVDDYCGEKSFEFAERKMLEKTSIL